MGPEWLPWSEWLMGPEEWLPWPGRLLWPGGLRWPGGLPWPWRLRWPGGLLWPGRLLWARAVRVRRPIGGGGPLEAAAHWKRWSLRAAARWGGGAGAWGRWRL
jgi:hypothetical protein